MNESIDSEARSCRAALTWARNPQKSNRPPGSTHESISNANPRTAQTAVESWRELQSRNIEFTMKRLREHDRALAGIGFFAYRKRKNGLALAAA